MSSDSDSDDMMRKLFPGRKRAGKPPLIRMPAYAAVHRSAPMRIPQNRAPFLSSYSSDSDDTAGFMRKLFPSRKRDHIPKKFNIWGDSDSDDDYKPGDESSGEGGGGGGSGDDDEEEKSPKPPKKEEKKDEAEARGDTNPFNATLVESEEEASAEPATPSAHHALTPLSPELQRVAQDVAKEASDPKIVAALQSGKALERIGAKKDITKAATRGVTRAVRTGALPRSKAAAFEKGLSAVAIASATSQARSSTSGAPLSKSMLEKLNEALVMEKWDDALAKLRQVK